MASVRTHGTFLMVLACAAACTQQAKAQINFGGGKRELPPAVRADVPYVKCGICQQFVKQAMRSMRTIKEGLKPGQKVGQPAAIGGQLRSAPARSPRHTLRPCVNPRQEN